jgi:hypothetical protein
MMATHDTKTRTDFSNRSREVGSDKGSSPSSSTTASQAKRMGEKGKEQLSEQTEYARQRVIKRGSEFVRTQKSNAAEEMNILGAAVREAGNKLKEEGQQNVASYAEAAADELERFGEYLRDRDVTRLRHDAAHFARQRPGVFFGGMFLVGLAASRFFKASDDKHREVHTGYEFEESTYKFDELGDELNDEFEDELAKDRSTEPALPLGSPTAVGGTSPIPPTTTAPGKFSPSSSASGTGPAGSPTNVPLPGELPRESSDSSSRSSDWDHNK